MRSNCNRHTGTVAAKTVSAMLPVERYMKGPVRTIDPRASLAEAREIMAAERLRHLVVVEGGRTIGVLADADIDRWEARKPVDPEVLWVAEAMAPDPYLVTPETSLAAVAATMAERRTDAAVVVGGGEPVGIFTVTDALFALAQLARA
jgi:CBS domain-containing protein